MPVIWKRALLGRVLASAQVMAPEGVVGSSAASAAAGPSVGYEHNGYRFKGGDPNAKASWEKVAP